MKLTKGKLTKVMSGPARAEVAFAVVLALLGPAHKALAAGGGQLELTVVDRDSGKPLACRVHLHNAAGKPRKIENVPWWNDHFILPGKITLKLPVGEYAFEMERGPEYLTRQGRFTINSFADDAKQVDLGRFIDMSAHGWWSGDLLVRRRAADMELLMQAEDLHVAQDVTWWNEKIDPAGRTMPQRGLLSFDGNRCCHLLAGAWTPPGSELLLLNLPGPAKPDFPGAYPAVLKQLATARKHDNAWIDLGSPASWDLPMLVAAGQVDSLELAHSHLCRDTIDAREPAGRPRDPRSYPGPRGMALWPQYIYFQLLECGLRIPPSAGSGSGVTPNPVGYNRVYVHLDGEFSYAKWWEHFRLGQVFVTNGPLLQPLVQGELPGHVFPADQGQEVELEIGLTLSTRDPITYLEIIQDGQVRHSVRFDEYAKSGRLPKLRFDRSGWFLLRAVTDVAATYRFAMTAPYYVEIGYERRISKRAAQFFLDWIYQRARQIKQADPQRYRETLDDYRHARDFWQDLVSRANAE